VYLVHGNSSCDLGYCSTCVWCSCICLWFKYMLNEINLMLEPSIVKIEHFRDKLGVVQKDVPSKRE
jgi:hypothetical protein